MSKILLALGLLAALAAPAAAGRLDVDSSQFDQAATVDTVVTRSISADEVADAESRLEKNETLFGANSR